jgi:methionyl-tRNA formyltransferase
MKLIYFGSSGFSVPPLRSLGISVATVVTKTAKPQGRGYRLDDNDVKRTARELGLPLIEINSFRDALDAVRLKELSPDLMIVASFGLIIPQWFLDIPSIGSINVHPSLLPRYRGPSPIQWAILKGDEMTGISIISMTARMDAGDVIYQEGASVLPGENAESLSKRLSARAAEIIPPLVEEIRSKGMPRGTAQDETSATFTPVITKEMGRIEWDVPARTILQKVRAFVEWPVAHTSLDGKVLRIFEGSILPAHTAERPGTIIDVTGEGICVAAQGDILVLSELQAENKRRMTAREFANGYRGLKGKVLGAQPV